MRDNKLKWTKKEKIDSRVLDEWEVKVLDSIHTKIMKISKKCRKKHVLSDKKCKDYMEEFQKHFVLVPADKASKNILIVCNKYYLDVASTEGA